jgi:hypothetical protein
MSKTININGISGTVTAVNIADGTITINNSYEPKGRYSREQIEMCIDQKAITYSGADVIIRALDGPTVRCDYYDSMGDHQGTNWLPYTGICSIPWYEVLKDTPLGKLVE